MTLKEILSKISLILYLFIFEYLFKYKNINFIKVVIIQINGIKGSFQRIHNLKM